MHDFTPAELKAQVDRIAGSAVFLRSDRLCRFLRFTVEQTLAGKGPELKEYLIGIEVLGKDPSFDPRLDSSVRVDARRLRAKLAEYYAGPGSADAIRIELPKGCYVPEFSLAALTRPAGAAARAGLSRQHAFIAAAALCAGLLAWQFWPEGREQRHEVRSLIVLPLANLTGEKQFDPLCDGLANELIERFSRIAPLRLVSRTTAFSYRGTAVDVREVARDQGVDSVLEGSVRKGSNGLRVSLQLVRGADGGTAWTESFDLMPGDEFGMQAQIARAIELRLASSLPPGAAYRPEGNEQDRRIETQVVQASYLAHRRTEEGVTRAIAYAQEAIRAKPHYAPAYAVLADAYLDMVEMRPPAEKRDLLAKSAENARRALELNGSLAGPYAVLAAIKLHHEWSWREAEELFQRGLELNPSHGVAHARYSRLLSLDGRHKEALQHAAQAEIFAPLNLIALAIQGQTHYYARQYEKAVEHLRKAMEIDPGFLGGRLTMARALALLGRRDEAWRALDPLSAGPLAAETRAVRSWLYALDGRKDQAREELRSASGATCVSKAGAWLAIGDKAAALSVIEQAVAAREPEVVYFKVTPMLDSLRGDRRLDAVCAKAGFSCR